MNRLTGYFLLFAMVLISSCGRLSEKELKEKKFVEEALTALKKLVAATEVGTNKIEYSKMLIDAQAKVNDVSTTVPEGDLKKEIKSGMESFFDSMVIWDLSEKYLSGEAKGRIAIHDMKGKNGENLDEKYQIGKKLNRQISMDNIFENTYFKREVVLPIIWEKAKEHTNRASTLYSEKYSR